MKKFLRWQYCRSACHLPFMLETPMPRGPRIYNLFPLLVGPASRWAEHLPRIAAMHFDWVYLNPFHYPGFSGSLYAVKDHHRLHPEFQGRSRAAPEKLLRQFLREAGRHGLKVMMDLVINHTAKDAPLAAQHPQWYLRDAGGELVSPSVADPDDPQKITVWGDLAEIDYRPRAERGELVEHWAELARTYAAMGFDGFRCDAAYKVPGEVWKAIIDATRAERPQAVFMAETLGCSPEDAAQLGSAGFDYFMNSSKWWPFEGDWLLRQYEAFRHLAPSISFPESHDTERLAAELEAQGIAEPRQIEAHYRLRYLFAAFFSSGVMMPMGYEFGFRRRLDVVQTRPSDWEQPLFDISPFIAETNRTKMACGPLNEEGPQSQPYGGEGVVVLLRQGGDGSMALATINPGTGESRRIAGHISRDFPDAADITPQSEPLSLSVPVELKPLEMRVFCIENAIAPVAEEEEDQATVLTGGHILIEAVYPEIDCGRYPVKREVGALFEVWADIFQEGHDLLAAALLYRRQGEPAWREAPMNLVDNDRWVGRFPLRRNTRYVYTIEAWTDHFATWRRDLLRKREAGQPLELELVEGNGLAEAALPRLDDADHARLSGMLRQIEEDPALREEVLLSEPLAALMARRPDRSAAVRYHRELEVVADRLAARFAAWYEMFPRSQGIVQGRSSTFADCARRLPDVRDMGFDVIYLVPIHPIGQSFRKGRNNALTAEPGDPGSPYAIGSGEGGHTAVHPELGTLEDFRAFVGECHRHGMEVALDFAVQCSPDHPWVREHPEWFSFRSDGSIKYAENPPKKYQDIVNVNFFCENRQALWEALRDVVLFWIDQGVKIFRVDNPHTKPVPFWEWLIRSVQTRHPDVLFLSEAFTRPKMLKALAKAGFTQSYSYFTWRNFKQEITDYLVELTQGESREYLRPNFFPNTPDILPVFLQTGGRPAFMIRFVLASTLSSVYGIYNGYELCENAAIPGKEEYLNSEKYEYKVWDWDRPGNIKEYIRRINHIRHESPALQEFTNLRFYEATDDNVLFYGKMNADRTDMIFIAVNLDPFESHEAELEFPLQAMGIPEDRSFEVEELLTSEKHLWRGARHHWFFDPQRNPAAIFRVVPWVHVDYRSPSL